MNFTRRGICAGAITSLFAGAPIASAHAADEESELVFSGKALDRSENQLLDRAMIQLLKKITLILRINPGFKYLDDENAFTTQEAIVKGTTGTVFLGVPLLRRLLRDFSNGGAVIAGVCSHECGHIYQYQYDQMSRLKRNDGLLLVELHADFLAGYCLNKLNIGSPGDLSEFFATDYARFNPENRGSHQQRTDALNKGFSAANDGQPIGIAADAGRAFVMSL
jgi:hypothetical protein